MNKSISILVLITAVICACSPAKEKKESLNSRENVYKGIPSTAYAVGENDSFIVFFNEEAIGDSIEGLPPIKQVSLWSYNKNRKEGRNILLSHPNATGNWFSIKQAVSIPLDSIPTITKVTILSWPNEHLKLLVEGSLDYRNVESFIICEDSVKAICLPSNRGLIGVSEEESFLIMQSYNYYNDGGRYNIIEAFDVNGNKVSSMNLKR